MNIWKDSKQIKQIQSAQFANVLLYFLQKLPFIGNHIPSHWYQCYSIKNGIGILLYFAFLLLKLVSRIALVFLIAIPVLLFVDKKNMLSPSYLFVFTALNIVMRPIFIQSYLTADKKTYIMLRLMKMESRRFLLGRFYHKLVIELFSLFISLSIFFSFHSQGTIWLALTYAMVLAIISVLAYTLGAALHVRYYDTTGSFLHRNYKATIIFCMLFLVLSYAPLYLFPTFIKSIGIGFTILCSIIILCVFSKAWKYLKNYPHYDDLMSLAIECNMTMINLSETMKKARANEFRLHDKDYSTDDLQSTKVNHLHGYTYLNKLFFKRHIRLIWKPLKIRLCVVFCAFLIACFLVMLMQDYIHIHHDILSILPPFVFLMYMISLGDKICKALFMNCDVALLQHGYYRQPKAILTNFKIRCKTLCFYNLIIACSICLATTAIMFIGKFPFTLVSLTLFNFTILCLSVFFSVHYLCIYYIFQPYNKELDMKNPFVSIIHIIVYILCYSSLQIQGTPLYVYSVVLLTIAYSFIALLLVYKLAPKTFHLK